MAERQASSLAVNTRKSLFCLFILTSTLFILSWFFVLRSTGSPHFIDHKLLPNSKLLAMIDNGISGSESQNDVEPSVGNRSILVDKEEEEKPTISSPDKEASQANNGVKCNTNGKVALKVFMYDLPPEFHFGLLDWKPQGRSVWPDLQTKVPAYPGGLNLQHSIEYWLTLDILASELPNPPNVRTAIRVRNSSEADIIFIPFFSSLSYNRFSRINPHQKKSSNKLLQDKLVKYVTAQQEWKISGGRDHLIVAHHPNSLLDGRMKLWPATFILSDFGRYPPNIANVEKDIIAPSKFCLNIAGDTPSSNRLFDAIASHCVPVIISDDIELPYEDVLDYSEFCIFVRTRDALKKNFLVNLTRSIGMDEWTQMWRRLQEVQKFYEFQYPSKEGDAVQMIWQAVARKVPSCLKAWPRRHIGLNKLVRSGFLPREIS